jgi:hypothetical protein
LHLSADCGAKGPSMWSTSCSFHIYFCVAPLTFAAQQFTWDGLGEGTNSSGSLG